MVAMLLNEFGNGGNGKVESCWFVFYAISGELRDFAIRSTMYLGLDVFREKIEEGFVCKYKYIYIHLYICAYIYTHT